MSFSGKHVCTLTHEPKCFDVPPNAGICRHLICNFRQLLLACEWHHGSVLFIRSRKSLKLEKNRQVATAHWLLWHPYSPIRFYWDCFAMCSTIAVFVYMPFQVFYECPNPYDSFILMSDFIAFLNLCTGFITGYVDEDNKVIVLDTRLIVKRYLRRYFIPDLISVLPLQLIEPFTNCQYPTHTTMFVFKLFRLATLRDEWVNLLQQLEVTYIKKVALTILLQGVLFLHWMAYFHYQVPAFFIHIYTKEARMLVWLHRFDVMTVQNSIFKKYTTNLFLVTGVCIGAGYYSATDEYLILELVQSATISIIGLIFITYCFSTLLRLVTYKQFKSHLFNGRYKELQQYMVYKRLPKLLQQKIQLFINYKFNGDYFNEEFIMNTINEQVKREINMHCCKRLVMTVPLFQDMPVALVNAIIFNLKQILYMPGEVVVKCGEGGSSLFLISSGTVGVMDSTGREVAHLRDGSFFGEKALFQPGVLRSATIIALEITEMYQLHNKELISCLQPYPRLRRRLEEAGYRDNTETFSAK